MHFFAEWALTNIEYLFCLEYIIIKYKLIDI